jgi:hypothetical protein
MSVHGAVLVAQRVAVVSRVVKSLTNLFHGFCGVLRLPSINPLKPLCVQSLYIDTKRTGIGINNKRLKFIITS